jgi:UDP-2,3-diacylglucosamine hydrolase
MSTEQTNQTARPKPVALFISDLHLQADMPATTAAFLSFLEKHARHAQQLYLLGDIFEYWAGDDDIGSPFPQRIVQALREVSDAGVELFWMAGNRDFLVGKEFAAATKATLLSDPHIITYGNQRYLISHGDLLCTDDAVYQQFRIQVRQPEWQAAFLARSLDERKSVIANMRQQSKLHQQEAAVITDVNQNAVNHFFADNHAQILIHGHTHRPAVHRVKSTTRYVLSDWDQDHATKRGDWIALLDDGSLQRYHYSGTPV